MASWLATLFTAVALLTRSATADRRCGWSWEEANANCHNACPDNVNEQCSGGMTCWSDLSSLPCDAGCRRCGRTKRDAARRCRSTCEADDDCPPRMKCWSGLKECGQPQADAGFVTGLPSGRSTRFWDCAKPSCAWSGRTPDVVKACARDGVTEIDDPDAMSAVDGGDAFACDDTQPRAVSDDLSYGTVAVSDTAMCGKCFDMTFTSGPVAGKRMRVRVVNTGTDVASVQFDIAMPGGGVGLMNACAAQHPEVDWGAQYGGIRDRDECARLPEALQPGCLWRFDWFMGADNPDFVYAEAPCEF